MRWRSWRRAHRPAVRDDEQREEIERQVGHIVAEILSSTPDHDVEPIHDMAERVRLVLAGRIRRGLLLLPPPAPC
ncbi:hypothetical protein AB0K12_20510 [Nonomuraea sp. NPDC049419]|uniref:hypothetical protein n=1 Tax=Nonomuraea sp. NPDC049419 TaxID=3155772 RepID=UPI0034220FD0